MGDGGDVPLAAEVIVRVRGDEIRRRHGVDVIHRIAESRRVRDLLPAFDTCRQIVADSGDLELRGYFRLVPQLALDTLHLNLIAIHRDLRRWRREAIGARLRRIHRARGQGCNESAYRHTHAGVRTDLRLRDLRVAGIVRPARHRVHISVVRKGVIRLQRHDVVIRIQMVRIGEAKIGVAINPRRELIEEPGQTVVRRIALGEVEVADRESRRLVHPETDGRRHAPAAILRIRTPGYATLSSHCIQPDGRAARDIAQRLIDVSRNAARGIGSKRGSDMHKPVRRWNFALLVDYTARGPAPELDTRRPFENLDLVVIKAVAVVAAEVPNPVQEYIVTRGKSPNREVITLSARFSGSNTDPWDVTNGVGESTILFIMQYKIRDHGHRLRCVEEVLGKFAHRNGRRQLRRHIDRVGVLQPDRGIIGILEAAIQPCSLQQLAQSAFRGVQTLKTGGVEGRELVSWNPELHSDAALLPVGFKGSVERARHYMESAYWHLRRDRGGLSRRVSSRGGECLQLAAHRTSCHRGQRQKAAASWVLRHFGSKGPSAHPVTGGESANQTRSVLYQGT